jgi:hypothetical protein
MRENYKPTSLHDFQPDAHVAVTRADHPSLSAGTTPENDLVLFWNATSTPVNFLDDGNTILASHVFSQWILPFAVYSPFSSMFCLLRLVHVDTVVPSSSLIQYSTIT